MIESIKSNYYYSVFKPDPVSEKAAVGLISAAFFASKVLGTTLTGAYLAYKWTYRPVIYYSTNSPISPPTEVTVPPSTNAASEVYYPISSHISFPTGLKVLSSMKSAIGVVMAENVKSKRLEPVIITQSTPKDLSTCQHSFQIVDRNNAVLGSATTFSYAEEAGHLTFTNPAPYYGRNSKIYLHELLNSSKTHKSIGYYLIKAALQWYKTRYNNQFGGRMDLAAAYNSHGFYYKLGFRSPTPTVNATIQQALHASSQTDVLGCKAMYLPPEAIAEWDKEIERYPIRMPSY